MARNMKHQMHSRARSPCRPLYSNNRATEGNSSNWRQPQYTAWGPGSGQSFEGSQRTSSSSSSVEHQALNEATPLGPHLATTAHNPSSMANLCSDSGFYYPGGIMARMSAVRQPLMSKRSHPGSIYFDDDAGSYSQTQLLQQDKGTAQQYSPTDGLFYRQACSDLEPDVRQHSGSGGTGLYLDAMYRY